MFILLYCLSFRFLLDTLFSGFFTFAGVFVQNRFPEADALRGDFEEFVFVDVFEALFQRHADGGNDHDVAVDGDGVGGAAASGV